MQVEYMDINDALLFAPTPRELLAADAMRRSSARAMAMFDEIVRDDPSRAKAIEVLCGNALNPHLSVRYSNLGFLTPPPDYASLYSQSKNASESKVTDKGPAEIPADTKLSEEQHLLQNPTETREAAHKPDLCGLWEGLRQRVGYHSK